MPDAADSKSPGTRNLNGSGAESRPGIVLLPPDANFLKRLFYRLFYRDPRNEKREGISWLVAYFFTGGSPVAFTVRDVGASGIYIYTDERWSIGTILRLALTDAQQSTPDRSLTVHARVMRWGKDGMGLEFILYDPKAKRRDWNVRDEMAATTKNDVQQFLTRIKNRSA